MSSGDKVWIFDDSCIGTVIKYGPYFSLITWEKDGIVHEEYLEHTEFSEYERLDDEEN